MRLAFRKSTQRQLCAFLVGEQPLFVVVGDEGRGSDSRLERNTVAAWNFEELQLSDSATAVKLACTNTLYCRNHMAPADNKHKEVFISSSSCSDNAVIFKASFVRTSSLKQAEVKSIQLVLLSDFMPGKFAEIQNILTVMKCCRVGVTEQLWETFFLLTHHGEVLCRAVLSTEIAALEHLV